MFVSRVGIFFLAGYLCALDDAPPAWFSLYSNQQLSQLTNLPPEDNAVSGSLSLARTGLTRTPRRLAAVWVGMEPHLILGIGELLWDLLPVNAGSNGTGAKQTRPKGSLGGAPANFTVMAGRLGSQAIILSRIGRDELGREAVARLDPLPVDTEYLQVDPHHNTGVGAIEFKDGNAHYVFPEPSAWDWLELTDDWVRLAERADAICFGSLAQRALESRQTIQTLAAQTKSKCVRVFDVNLRPPFYSSEVIQESLELATVMKMNDAEVPLVLGLLGLPTGDCDDSAGQRCGAERLLSEFPTLHLVAITRGGKGSLLVTREAAHEHPGVPAKVADTIGAGDAFTAAMTYYLMRGADLATVNEAGNRWGSWVASQVGAMPPLAADVETRMKSAIETHPAAAGNPAAAGYRARAGNPLK